MFSATVSSYPRFLQMNMLSNNHKKSIFWTNPFQKIGFASKWNIFSNSDYSWLFYKLIPMTIFSCRVSTAVILDTSSQEASKKN